MFRESKSTLPSFAVITIILFVVGHDNISAINRSIRCLRRICKFKNVNFLGAKSVEPKCREEAIYFRDLTTSFKFALAILHFAENHSGAIIKKDIAGARFR